MLLSEMSLLISAADLAVCCQFHLIEHISTVTQTFTHVVIFCEIRIISWCLHCNVFVGVTLSKSKSGLVFGLLFFRDCD